MLGILHQRLTVDLFDPPQRAHFRTQVVEMRAAGIREREIAKRLGITKTAAQRAAALDRVMRSLGLSEPYLAVLEPSKNNPKLRRHLHPRYRFEPLPDAGIV
jgi:hypothetical protein